MARKLTRYNRPPISEQIGTAINIDVLASFRQQLSLAMASGELQPKLSTLRDWTDELWSQVACFIDDAKSEAEIARILEVTDAWPKPAGLTAALQEQARVCRAALVVVAEREETKL